MLLIFPVSLFPATGHNGVQYSMIFFNATSTWFEGVSLNLSPYRSVTVVNSNEYFARSRRLVFVLVC